MVVHTWQPESRWPQSCKFPFMKLPLEIRDMIYLEVFERPVERNRYLGPVYRIHEASFDRKFSMANKSKLTNDRLRKFDKKWAMASRKDDEAEKAALPARLSILRVSKQVHTEATEILYGDYYFFHARVEAWGTSLGLNTTNLSLSNLGDLPAMSQIRNLRISINPNGDLYPYFSLRDESPIFRSWLEALVKCVEEFCTKLALQSPHLKDLIIQFPCFCGLSTSGRSSFAMADVTKPVFLGVSTPSVKEILQSLRMLRARRNVRVECHCWEVEQWELILSDLVSSLKGNEQ